LLLYETITKHFSLKYCLLMVLCKNNNVLPDDGPVTSETCKSLMS